MGQGKVVHADAQSQVRMGFFDGKFVGLHNQQLLHRWVSRALKRFIGGSFASFANLQKSAKPARGRELVGFVCGIELQHGAIFVAHTKTRQALPPVDVKRPRRAALFACYAGQKTGKRGLAVVVVDDETVVAIELVGTGMHIGRNALRSVKGQW